MNYRKKIMDAQRKHSGLYNLNTTYLNQKDKLQIRKNNKAQKTMEDLEKNNAKLFIKLSNIANSTSRNHPVPSKSLLLRT